jgi:hypothetical protein
VTGGITTAVAKLTSEINDNTEIPTWLATRQIAFLSKKASELMTPFTAQANTIKAQLTYATANMKAYYSQYATGQRLNTSAQNSAGTQLNRVMSAGGIDPTDTAAIADWSAKTGIPADQIAAAAQTKNLLTGLTVSGKEATQVANAQLEKVLNDPAYIQSMANGLNTGAVTADVLAQLTGRGTIGAAITSAIVSRAQEIADANGNPSGVNYQGIVNDVIVAQNPAIRQRVTALQTVQNLTPAIQELSDAASRSNIQSINGAIQSVGIQFGGTTYNNFEDLATIVQSELSGVVGYGSASDQSRSIAAVFANPNQSPEQFMSSWNKVIVPALNATGAAIAAQAGTQASSLNLNSDGSTGNKGTGGSNSNPAGL